MIAFEVKKGYCEVVYAESVKAFERAIENGENSDDLESVLYDTRNILEMVRNATEEDEEEIDKLVEDIMFGAVDVSKNRNVDLTDVINETIEKVLDADED